MPQFASLLSKMLACAGLFALVPSSRVVAPKREQDGAGPRHKKARLSKAGPTCLNGDGESVDYHYAFKYPADWRYAALFDGGSLETAADTLDQSSSPVSRTLDQLYADYKEFSYALWNDEIAGGPTVAAPWAHAKGVFAFGTKRGFWLTHSLPKFPQPPGRPKSSASSFEPEHVSHRYGQSWLCITIDKTSLPTLARLFTVDALVAYAVNDNAKLGEVFTTWANIYEGKKASSDVSREGVPEQHVVELIHSAGGSVFTAFAKSGAFKADLYHDIVAPHFKKALIVETWQNGHGDLPSYCDGHNHVMTVQHVRFDGTDGGEWDVHMDHSKWAVSEDGHVLCVGDLNRQVSQEERGGGTVCKTDAHIARQILSTVENYEACHHH